MQSPAPQHHSYHGVVEILVNQGKDFPRMDLNGEADPFCVLKLGERKLFTTRTVLKTRNPVWHDVFRILVPEEEKNYTIFFDVWDWDKASSNDHIGEAKLELSEVFSKKEFKGWLPVLKYNKGHHPPKHRGEIEIKYKAYSNEEVLKEFWKDIYDYFRVKSETGITQLELAALLEGIGSPMRNHQLAKLMAACDVNHDGEISFQQFFVLVTGQRPDLDTKTQKLVAKMQPLDPNLPWTTFAMAAAGEAHTPGDALVSNWHHCLRIPTGELGKHKPAEIMVHNRETGKLENEKIPNYIKIAMRLMYTGGVKFAVDTKEVKAILKSMTVKQGKKYDNPASIKEIEHFIEFHQLNRDEILDPINEFKNFNEFFYRKLKPTARPIAFPSDPKVAVSPADCRVNVYSTIAEAQRLWIKGHHFSLTNLLQDADLAARYEGGSLVIARLAPQDYHRFHVPVNGTLRPFTPIDGTYFTVNPISVNTAVDVYTENKRVVCPMDSPEFGLVTYVTVGATMVGSIHFTTTPGQTVRKGDEHGYFAFGGSTVLLLFEPGTIEFDEDLLANSQKPIETLVKVGTSIGRATK